MNWCKAYLCIDSLLKKTCIWTNTVTCMHACIYTHYIRNVCLNWHLILTSWHSHKEYVLKIVQDSRKGEHFLRPLNCNSQIYVHGRKTDHNFQTKNYDQGKCWSTVSSKFWFKRATNAKMWIFFPRKPESDIVGNKYVIWYGFLVTYMLKSIIWSLLLVL